MDDEPTYAWLRLTLVAETARFAPYTKAVKQHTAHMARIYFDYPFQSDAPLSWLPDVRETQPNVKSFRTERDKKTR